MIGVFGLLKYHLFHQWEDAVTRRWIARWRGLCCIVPPPFSVCRSAGYLDQRTTQRNSIDFDVGKGTDTHDRQRRLDE